MKCPCCNKPINLIEDIEPVFGLPDRIVEVHPSLRAKMGPPASTPASAKALISDDVCILQLSGAEVFFLRVVLPVEVTDRPGHPCNWGVWVEVDKEVALASALQGSDGAVPLKPGYDGNLANDIGVRLDQPPLLGARVFVRPHDDAKRRWSAVLNVEHPFADEQRQGVTRERVLQWTRPWHHLVGN